MISTWKTILSPKSMSTLSTPLALFCRSYLVVAIGSDTAEEVMRYSYAVIKVEGESGKTSSYELENGYNSSNHNVVSLTITENTEITIIGNGHNAISTDSSQNVPVILSYSKVDPVPSTIVEEIELDSSNGYSYTWTGLDGGYQYSIVEKDVPEGYTVSYSASGITNGTINVINRKKPGSLQITKTTTGNNTPATAQFVISRPDGYSKTVYYNDFVETDEEGKRVYTVTGLEPGEYTVTENVESAQLNRYVLTVTGDQGVAKNVVAGGTAEAKLTNVYSKKTSVSVTKDWKDGNGNPLDDDTKDLQATVVLYRALSDAATATPEKVSKMERPDYSVALTKDNNWTYTWTDLPKQNGDGIDYIYYVMEEDVNGFSIRYTPLESIGDRNFGRAKASETDDSVLNVAITNFKSVSYSMPATGGEGTHRIYLIGLMLIALAGAGFIMIRRRKEYLR